MSHLFKTIVALVVSGFGCAFANDLPLNLTNGEIGQLRIGQSVTDVENILGHQLNLDFLGDGRDGLVIENKDDLRSVEALKFDGVNVEGVELLFIKTNGPYRLSFISMLLACDDVRTIGKRLNTSKRTVVLKKDGSWTTASRKSKYLLAGETLKGCSVWLRAR